MKTIEALYQEVLVDNEMKKAFVKATQEDSLEAFLKENGCDATADEVQAFLAEETRKEGELADAELGAVSGGCGSKHIVYHSEDHICDQYEACGYNPVLDDGCENCIHGVARTRKGYDWYICQLEYPDEHQ